MSLEKDTMILSQVSFFESLTSDQLRLLSFGSEKEKFSAGALLFLKGEKSDCGYVVMDGAVNLVETPEDSSNIPVTVKTGELIGELALVTDILHPTSAIVQTDSELLLITRKLFTRMLKEYPELARDFYQKMSGNLNSVITGLDKVRHNMTLSPD